MKIDLSRVLILSKRIEALASNLLEPITYQELCNQIERHWDIKYNPHNKWISHALYEVCKRNAYNEEPACTAMVVNKATGVPSDGFFSACVDVGYIFESNESFWKEQVILTVAKNLNK